MIMKRTTAPKSSIINKSTKRNQLNKATEASESKTTTKPDIKININTN